MAATTLDIDELNINRRSMPYEKFFGEMRLTKEQIRRRILLAEDFEDMMLYVFGLIAEYISRDMPVDYDNVRNEIETEYQRIAGNEGVLDDDMLIYTAVFANDFIRSTKRMMGNEVPSLIAEVLKDYSSGGSGSILQSVIKTAGEENKKLIEQIVKDTWFISDDRARFIAENESLTVEGYKDFKSASGKGYTRKQWIAIEDERTRPTHSLVDGTVVPIDDFFEVGAARLYYPHDTVIGNGAEHPEEIISCRCWVVFLR